MQLRRTDGHQRQRDHQPRQDRRLLERRPPDRHGREQHAAADRQPLQAVVAELLEDRDVVEVPRMDVARIERRREALDRRARRTSRARGRCPRANTAIDEPRRERARGTAAAIATTAATRASSRARDSTMQERRRAQHDRQEQRRHELRHEAEEEIQRRLPRRCAAAPPRAVRRSPTRGSDRRRRSRRARAALPCCCCGGRARRAAGRRRTAPSTATTPHTGPARRRPSAKT